MCGFSVLFFLFWEEAWGAASLAGALGLGMRGGMGAAPSQVGEGWDRQPGGSGRERWQASRGLQVPDVFRSGAWPWRLRVSVLQAWHWVGQECKDPVRWDPSVQGQEQLGGPGREK